MYNHEEMPRLVVWKSTNGRLVTLYVTDEDGTAYDLTGFTVTVSGRIGDAYKISDKACTLSDAAAGKVTFTPSAAETATSGIMLCQLKLDNGGGVIDFTEPFVLDVREAIDA